MEQLPPTTDSFIKHEEQHDRGNIYDCSQLHLLTKDTARAGNLIMLVNQMLCLLGMFSTLPMRCSMRSTASFAPPCRGPYRAPTAPDTAVYTSTPLQNENSSTVPRPEHGVLDVPAFALCCCQQDMHSTLIVCAATAAGHAPTAQHLPQPNKTELITTIPNTVASGYRKPAQKRSCQPQEPQALHT